MNTGKDKITDLTTAINTYVFDGCHISIGGFTINRNPMAAVHEIIRQGKRDLHLYAHANGQGVDELIGAGCIGKLDIAYCGNARYAPTCLRFQDSVEKGSIKVEDYSNFHMGLRFLAGAMGLPFMPTTSSLGTDIVNKWGFDKSMRKQDVTIPDKKAVVVDNPFGSWAGRSKVLLVPAINTDVTIIHVQKADKEGTVRIEGLTFADIEQAKCAKTVIVTCEDLVEPEQLRTHPDYNQIPFFYVDAVVHVPLGAYPTACYHYYDYDPTYLKDYGGFAENEEGMAEYLNNFIRGTKNHEELINLVGEERIKKIRADLRTGYSPKMVR
jgi:glutaconate CoA-transferase subunit A